MTTEAASISPSAVVDTRGMRCPWPALRLARAMRDATYVTLIADDPQAAREITALATQQGWKLQPTDSLANAQQWRVRRG